MAVSIHTSANFFARERFTPWNPTTNTVAGTPLIGRKKRIDPFVSLWHRSSRRVHIYLRPGQDASAVQVLRHDSTGSLYLISETSEEDAWIGGVKYTRLLRAHCVDPPSGGVAQFRAVRTQGSGANLGPVVLQSPVYGYADVELRSTHKADDAEEVSIAEYFVAYTRNFAAVEGDFIEVNGQSYRLMEQHSDSGYRYCRASQESPKFKTVEFWFPATMPAVYDPITGTMTTGAYGIDAETGEAVLLEDNGQIQLEAPGGELSRQVSVLFGDQAQAGRTPEHDVEDRLTLFIYLNHIGFDPWIGQALTWGGRRYRVIGKSLRIEERQIKLEVSG